MGFRSILAAAMSGMGCLLGGRKPQVELGLPEREPEPKPADPEPSDRDLTLGRLGSFGGMRIIENPHLTKRVPLFPDKPRTKRRMRRVIGKYGRWDKEVPTYLVSGNMIIAHPAVVDRIRVASHR